MLIVTIIKPNKKNIKFKKLNEPITKEIIKKKEKKLDTHK